MGRANLTRLVIGRNLEGPGPGTHMTPLPVGNMGPLSPTLTTIVYTFFLAVVMGIGLNSIFAGVHGAAGGRVTAWWGQFEATAGITRQAQQRITMEAK